MVCISDDRRVLLRGIPRQINPLFLSRSAKEEQLCQSFLDLSLWKKERKTFATHEQPSGSLIWRHHDSSDAQRTSSIMVNVGLNWSGDMKKFISVKSAITTHNWH